MVTDSYWEHSTGNAGEGCHAINVDDDNIYLRFVGYAYRSYEYQFIKVDMATMTTQIYDGYTPSDAITIGGPYTVPLVDGKLYFINTSIAPPYKLIDEVDATTMTLIQRITPTTSITGTYSYAFHTDSHVYLRGGSPSKITRISYAGIVSTAPSYVTAMCGIPSSVGLVLGRYDSYLSVWNESTMISIITKATSMRVYTILYIDTIYYLLGHTSTNYPSVTAYKIGYADGKVVTNLIHRYDRMNRIYNLELVIGGVTSEFGMPEWTTRPVPMIKNEPDPAVAEEVEKQLYVKTPTIWGGPSGTIRELTPEDLARPGTRSDAGKGDKIWQALTPWKESGGQTFKVYDEFVVNVAKKAWQTLTPWDDSHKSPQAAKLSNKVEETFQREFGLSSKQVQKYLNAGLTLDDIRAQFGKEKNP
jgi:hypothetical protein